jgi:hypothetical protein
MTHLGTDVLTLTHVAITLVAILSGFVVLAQMLKSRWSGGWTGVFLAMSVLTNVTGFVFFHPDHPPTPAQVTGVVALIVLVPTLYGLYGAHLRGAWRWIYVVGAVISLWFNLFVLVTQTFDKVPGLCATMPACPAPGGPLFGAAQGIVLLATAAAGWLAVKRFHPSAA